MRKVILHWHFTSQFKSYITLVLLAIFLISGNPLLAIASAEDVKAVPDIPSHNDLQRGERFFKGLLPKDRKF